MFSHYQDALQYLYNNLPVFQRVGASAYKPDLTNTYALCEALGNPQLRFKSIHVAGTNGKGSTSHLLASVLHAGGYKTGLYTSPHLKEFTERIRVNGDDVSREFVVDFVNRIRPVIERIKPSFFEITVAMAFDYFARLQVDIAVVEVGLGGRLDSTNIITPILSVITNIGWDHTDLLGDTLEKIAGEKAGIIKRHVPIVISERQQAVEPVFQAKASQEDAPLYFAADDYRVEEITDSHSITFSAWRHNVLLFEKLPIPLQGYYQQKNLVGVLKAIDLLTQSGFVIEPAVRDRGLIDVIRNTRLKGRWQKLGDSPLIICDTGHNEDGIREVVRQIKAQRYDALHIVLGMVKDKDISNVLALLPREATYYFCQATIPRALDASLLAGQAGALGLKGSVLPDVNEALQQAKAAATANDFIFIGGSTFVVAEIKDL